MHLHIHLQTCRAILRRPGSANARERRLTKATLHMLSLAKEEGSVLAKVMESGKDTELVVRLQSNPGRG